MATPARARARSSASRTRPRRRPAPTIAATPTNSAIRARARRGARGAVRSTATRETSASTSDIGDDASELLPSDENAEFQRRWETIQTGFVDEPRQTVEQADELVAQVMKRLAEGFAAERERLEQQWGRGEDVSTEDLRVALQRYRGFFQRLLSA